MARLKNLRDILNSPESMSEKCLEIIQFLKQNDINLNNEEYIFAWICENLSNQTEDNLSENDIQGLWLVMGEVLEETLSNTSNITTRKLVLPSSIPKLILHQLNIILQLKTTNEKINKSVYKSLKSIVNSQNLASVFTQQTVLFFKILGKLLQIYSLSLPETPKQNPDECLTLLGDVVENVLKYTLSSNALDSQTYVKEFLKYTFIPFTLVISHKECTSNYELLVNLIRVVFCKRENIKRFGTEYLELTKSENKSPGKNNSSLLELLHYLKQSYSNEHAQNFGIVLGLILQGILQRCGNELYDAPFMFLSLTLKSLKIFSGIQEQAADVKTESSPNPSSSLLILEHLLCSCSKFRQALLLEDKVSRIVQLKWFGDLNDWLLSLSTEEISNSKAVWYNCLKMLASFSPEIIEPIIQNIWKFAWLNSPFLNVNEDEGAFLSQILEDYVSLRQVPKLFLKLSTVITEDKQSQVVNQKHYKKLPFLFRANLSMTIAKLGVNQLIELWNTLVKIVSIQNCMNQGVYTAVEILKILMKHIKLSDGGIPPPHYIKINQLMKRTGELASILLNMDVPNQVKHYLALELIHSWCFAHVAMKVYLTDNDDGLTCKLIEENDNIFNLDVMYPFANFELTEILQKSAQSKHKQLSIAALQLVIKKASFICIIEQHLTASSIKTMRNIASFIYGDLGSKTIVDGSTINPDLSNVDSENYALAVYSWQLRMIPLFSNFLSAKKLCQFFSTVLKYSSSKEDLNKQPRVKTAYSVTEDFLSSRLFTESKKMQTACITAMLSDLAQVVSLEKVNLKRKHNEDLPEDKNLFLVLAKNPKTWDATPVPSKQELTSGQLKNNETWNTLKTASDMLNDNDENQKLVIKEEELLKFLKVLRTLGPGNMIPTNSLRCIIGLLYLRSGLKSLSNATNYVSLASSIHQLIFLFLENCDAYWISNLLNVENLLKETVSINRILPHGRELDFWINKATDRICFLALHDIMGPICLEKIVQQIEKTQDSFRDIHFLQIVLWILIRKLKIIFKPDYIKVCQTLAVYVAQILKDELVSVKRFKGLEENEKFYSYHVCLLSFQALIEFYTKCQNSEKEIEAKLNVSILLKKFKSFLSLALENLEGENDVQLVQTALYTIISVLSIKETHNDNLPPSFLIDCWKKVKIQIKIQILSHNLFKNCHDTCNDERKYGTPLLEVNGIQFGYLDKPLEDTLKLALKKILLRANSNDLSEILIKLEEDSLACGTNFNTSDFQTVLFTWNSILGAEIEDLSNLRKCFQTFFRTLFLLLHEFQETNSHLSDVIIPSLEFLSYAIPKGFVHTNNVSECLQICSFLSPGKFSKTNSVNRTVTLTTYMVEILNESLGKHSAQILSSAASFLGIFGKVTLYLVDVGDQKYFNAFTQTEQGLIISCIQKLEKLVLLMSNHLKTFSKLVFYIIADYISKIQQLTLQPIVKELLIPVLNKMLKICDEHLIPVLRISLNEGGRDILEIMYRDYQKYYEFKGKI